MGCKAHQYQTLLMEIVSFLEPFRAMINASMATFISEDLWSKCLNGNLMDAVDEYPGTLSSFYDQLFAYCTHLWSADSEAAADPKNLLETFARDAWLQSSALAKLCCTEKDKEATFGVSPPTENGKPGAKLESLLMMTDKKLAEVQAMAFYVNRVFRNIGTSSVIDIGSGKGYLTTALSMLYGLDVIGLESSPSNVSSAQIRFQRLSKQSSALRKRIDRDWGTVKVEPGCARFVTCAVDATLDLRKTLESPCTVTPSVDYLLCGLHTCGALGGNLTELFIKNSSAKALIFVGCCYHLMDERSSCGLKKMDESCVMFPQTSYLRCQSYYLGQNARMLASQSVDRALRSNLEDSNRSLFYRALLQVLLDRHFRNPGKDISRVGKIYVPKMTFPEYVSAAKSALLIDIPVSEEECRKLLQHHEEWETRLKIFVLLRLLLAPLIEQVILLDRVCYLTEQEVIQSVEVVQLFDPCVSPRSWCITAVKCPQVA